MNKIKHFYSSPTAELLVVRFEENILSNQISGQGTEQGNSRDGDDEGYGWN